jgi:hypothetical protein
MWHILLLADSQQSRLQCGALVGHKEHTSSNPFYLYLKYELLTAFVGIK